MNGRVQSSLDYADAVADWLVSQARARLAAGDLNATLHFAFIAAGILSRQNRILVSAPLEAVLRDVASRLPAPASIEAEDSPLTRGCLHVLTEALPAGGLTAMALRWIGNDDSGCRHNVVLLSQQAPVPAALEAAVSKSGGRVYIADPQSDWISRAAWLRQLAYREAAHVVLHVDVSDVICPVAFGVDGGPAVMLVNHSAHVFWTGATTADLLLNCRGSKLESEWASRHRGFPQHAPVPIPLAPCGGAANGGGVVPIDVARQEARTRWGIQADAVVILTVGAAFKFLPANGLDFVDTCLAILKRVPEAVLVGVGFQPDQRWQLASAAVGGRMHALGVMDRAALTAVHGMADIYVEGFPFGTTTALLEAALAGIPVVLAPADCPPPYGSDGIALDDALERPETVEAFSRQVIGLCRDRGLRERLGREIQASVAMHHETPGWNQHLRRAIASLPAVHAVRPSLVVQRTPETIHAYWTGFVRQWGAGYSMTLESAIGSALAAGYRPRLTQPLIDAAHRLRACGDAEVPMPLLRLLCNRLLPMVPLPVGRRLYRLACFLGRRALAARVRGKFVAMAVPSPVKGGWYEEFRQLRR